MTWLAQCLSSRPAVARRNRTMHSGGSAHPARGRQSRPVGPVVFRAGGELRDMLPDGKDQVAWDPENVLGDGPTDHFARRERERAKGNPEGASQAPVAASLEAKPAGRTKFAEVPTLPSASEEVGFGAEVEAAFLDVFGDKAPRVLESFRRLRRGEEFVQMHPGEGVQRAGSFMEGLTAVAFPDMDNGQYEWLKAVEENADVIQREFALAMKDPGSMLVRGNRVWAKAARDEAVAYGPNWRTLVLQDRGIWEQSNIKIFPRTHKLLVDIDAPTLEVFFARQDAKTGISSHTDNSNFIQTTHLGVDVPEGECWIKVGEHTHNWMNRKLIICDTSFMHETSNESENDRYVLIMRHWHPEVTEVEKAANQFLFEALDDGTSGGVSVAKKQAQKRLNALLSVRGKKKKGGKRGGTSGGGFGSKKC